MSLRVLVVCTGNICRSPIAERVLGARLAAAGIDAVVTSAGTGAYPGQSMTPEAAERVRRLGADPTGHGARQLTERSVAEADLVLTATTDHRAAAVTLVPRAVRRIFTLREFAGLAAIAELPGSGDAGAPADPREVIEAVAAARGLRVPVGPGADDVVDPFRCDAAVYDEAAARIDEAVDAAVRAFTGRRVDVGGG
ncbi:low molecular weight phosphatase family protein [Agromyces sp. MMS24-JH15]|uniref:arsenate reductase/protein-tyrosine-phosphatase family protein n=1 Tax=Agromyces sp. MMS24-JH15 TaxID=3243765 RepID=UPI003747FB2F